MATASRTIAFQLTPGEYRRAAKRATACGYPSPDLFIRAQALEHLGTNISADGLLNSLTTEQCMADMWNLSNDLEDLAALYDRLVDRASRLDDQLGTGNLLPSSIFGEQRDLIRQLIDVIDDVINNMERESAHD